MTTLLLLVLLGPAGLAAVSLPFRRAAWTRWTPVAAAVVVLGSGVALVAGAHDAAVTALGGLLRADSLAAYLVCVVGAVALTATWGGIRPRATPDGWFSTLLCSFLATMVLALVADNLGVMWVALEATTITTAFLVGYGGGKRSLEAAWKYVVLGSVGVAIALLGIVLLYAATSAAGHPTLSWVELRTMGSVLDPDLTRLGVALAALGFATKAGLAPMHSWLPDAHSQAPSPVSALMSGVLLAVAFAGILRVKAISDAVLGESMMRGLLIAAGLLSLLVAALLLLTQRDYKRMLAYSSIEHMGIIAIGGAIGGPLAIGAVLLHILGHGLAKATLFVVAGRMLAFTGTSRIDDVSGLLGRAPKLAVPFLMGSAALLGFPPFGLFFSELAIIVAGWQAGLTWVVTAMVALLLLVFAGLGRHILAMTLTRHRGGEALLTDGYAGLLAAAGEVAEGAEAGKGAEPGKGAEAVEGAEAGKGAEAVKGAEAGELAPDEPTHTGFVTNAHHGSPDGPMAPLWLALTAVAVSGLLAWPLLGVLTDAVASLIPGVGR